MFHKEGHKIIFATLVFIVAAFLLIDNFLGMPWLQKTLEIGLLVFFVLILQFFRNPKRHTVKNNNQVIAPVDGKVVVIEEVEEPEYFKDKRLQVSVFMSPLKPTMPTAPPYQARGLFSCSSINRMAHNFGAPVTVTAHV